MHDEKLSEAYNHILAAMRILTEAKTQERTEKDRYLAVAVTVAVTDLQKVAAWLHHTDGMYAG